MKSPPTPAGSIATCPWKTSSQAMHPAGTRNRQANGRSGNDAASEADRCAGAGIGRSLVLGMRGAGRSLDVSTGAGAGIDHLRRLESRQDVLIQRPAFGLDVGCRRSANVRSLVPVQAEPGQVRDGSGSRFGAHAGRVEVLDSQHHSPAAGPGRQPGDQERPGVTEVQPSRGRGRQAADQPVHGGIRVICDGHRPNDSPSCPRFDWSGGHRSYLIE